jgi:tripartite-type tricarboxylate transporter receptor subunit TctC
MRTASRCLALVMLIAAGMPPSLARDYPDKTIRIIVP